MMVKRQWVVGFLLDTEAESVILIRKNRPEWQAGKLNGVGGKVEPLETPDSSMRREFVEETGVWVPDWHHFATLTWEEGLVHFFRAFESIAVLERCRTMTDETVEVHSVPMLGVRDRRWDITPNLLWLVPLAAHRHDTYDLIDVVETGATLRKTGPPRRATGFANDSGGPVMIKEKSRWLTC